jgi:hypothetical protein
MTVGMKSTTFWVVTPFSLVQVYRCFGGAFRFYLQVEDYTKQATINLLQ